MSAVHHTSVFLSGSKSVSKRRSPWVVPIFLFGIIYGTFKYSFTHGASATALATARVITAIGISKNSDLAFGEGNPGDGNKTVTADATATPQNASFTVSGEPNRTYSISLPSDGVTVLITGAGDTPTTRIPINQFVSYPTAASGGNLDSGGSQALIVGATRSALAADQATGAYSGTFTVTVVY